jgi:predicted short-subunit dehydrogenase-like oxidoreductase (DUF2520 family)
MSERLSSEPRIAIVGAGNLARTLAPALRAAGYEIEAIVSRERAGSLHRARTLAREVGASAIAVGRAELNAEIIWFCVPDKEIARAAQAVAAAGDWKNRNKVALHSSGVLTSDELTILRRRGASVGSVHPLMTFVRGSLPPLAGVPFAVEGSRKAVTCARSIVLALHGRPFTIRKLQKAAYHAWGMFASPLFTALLAVSERVAGAAGVSRRSARQRMLPILRQTLINYGNLGASGSFSGPIARGDVETVRMHLNVLRDDPAARDAYIALARVALHELPAKNRIAFEAILKRRT